MTRYRYHPKIGLPRNLNLPQGVFPLTYSRHAVERAQEKAIWLHRLPAFLDTRQAKLVDVETTDGVLTAAAYRQFWTQKTDLILVVQPEEGPWLVRSVTPKEIPHRPPDQVDLAEEAVQEGKYFHTPSWLPRRRGRLKAYPLRLGTPWHSLQPPGAGVG